MIPRRFLHINSMDRTVGNPSSFTLVLPTAIKCSKAKLISAAIPNSYHNITNSNNGITVGGTTYKIPFGSYTLSDLFTQIPVTIPAITSIVFNDVNCNVVITTSSSTTISFPSTGSMNFVLGFPTGYSQTGTTFTGSFSPSVDQFSIFIEIDELYNNYLTSNNKNSTFVISNNTNKNGIMFFYQQSQYEQFVNLRAPESPLQVLTISVRDIFGEILHALPEWNFLLEIC